MRLRYFAALLGLFILTANAFAQAQQATPPPDSAEALKQQLNRLQQRAMDWPQLSRYKDANTKVPAPAKDEDRVVFMGDAQSSGRLQKTGSKHPQPLGGNPFLLPQSHHISSHRIDQRHHSNCPPSCTRLPQLREPQGHLLLDGWRPKPQNPFCFYPSSLAKRPNKQTRQNPNRKLFHPQQTIPRTYHHLNINRQVSRQDSKTGKARE